MCYALCTNYKTLKSTLSSVMRYVRIGNAVINVLRYALCTKVSCQYSIWKDNETTTSNGLSDNRLGLSRGNKTELKTVLFPPYLRRKNV